MNLTLNNAQAREITIRYLREQYGGLLELFDDVSRGKCDASVAAEILASADKLLKVLEYLGSDAQSSALVLSENELQSLVKTSYE
jgi:hypothetical protein